MCINAKLWFESLIHPNKAVGNAADLKTGLLNLVLAFFVSLLVLFATYMYVFYFSDPDLPHLMPSLENILVTNGAILLALMLALMLTIALMWFSGKLLGGKAKLGNYFGAVSFPASGAVVLTFIFVTFVSILFIVHFAPNILLAITSTWVVICVIVITEKVHKVTREKAAISVVIVPLLWMLLPYVLNFLAR
jgi:hypothetical protein